MQRKLQISIVAVIIIAIVIGASLYYLYGPIGGPEERTTIVVGTTDTHAHIDPATADGLTGETFSILVFDTLYRYKPESSELYPVLATNVVKEAADQYLITLREGVNFHDGTPFNSTAVKYSWERTGQIGKGISWAFTSFIDRVEIIDLYTIRVFLKLPFAPFKHLLALSSLAIVSPTAAEKHGGLENYEEFDKYNIGSGPFKFVEFVQGDKLVLEANKDYWNPDRVPKFDRLLVKYYADASTMKFGLETGELDIVTRSINVADVDSLETNPDVNVLNWQWMGYPMNIVFNLDVHPLNNIYIRRAIAYCIDYAGIVSSAVGGKGYRVYSWEIPSWPTYYPAYNIYNYNKTKALELIAKAREVDSTIPESIELELSHSGIYFGADVPTFVTILQSNLEDIGIDVNVLNVDQVTHRNNRKAGLWQIAIYSWSPEYEDAHYMADSLMHPEGSLMVTNGYNSANYDPIINPIHPDEAASLVEQGVAELDDAKRIEIYHEIQRLGAEDLPHIWVYTRNNYLFTRANVHGLIGGPCRTMLDFALVSKESSSTSSALSMSSRSMLLYLVPLIGISMKIRTKSKKASLFFS